MLGEFFSLVMCKVSMKKNGNRLVEGTDFQDSPITGLFCGETPPLKFEVGRLDSANFEVTHWPLECAWDAGIWLCPDAAKGRPIRGLAFPGIGCGIRTWREDRDGGADLARRKENGGH